MFSQRDNLILSFLTFITALSWIAFDVYHASVDTTIPKNLEEQLVPITPTFDREIIQKVKRRKNIDISESSFVISPEAPSPPPQLPEIGIPQPTTLAPTTSVRQDATQSGGP